MWCSHCRKFSEQLRWRATRFYLVCFARILTCSGGNIALFLLGYLKIKLLPFLAVEVGEWGGRAMVKHSLCNAPVAPFTSLAQHTLTARVPERLEQASEFGQGHIHVQHCLSVPAGKKQRVCPAFCVLLTSSYPCHLLV